MNGKLLAEESVHVGDEYSIDFRKVSFIKVKEWSDWQEKDSKNHKWAKIDIVVDGHFMEIEGDEAVDISSEYDDYLFSEFDKRELERELLNENI